MHVSDRLSRYQGERLLSLAQLEDPDARSVILGGGTDRIDIIVTRQNGIVRAYLNECPHAGTPLETFDGTILDREDPSILVCSTHGARFRISDGYCLSGPCREKALSAVPVMILDGEILIAGSGAT